MTENHLAPHTGPDGHTDQILRKIRRYLPSQAPLKDFVHHNPLHAFQHEPFHAALSQAAGIFGYKVYLFLNEYRARFESGEISQHALDRVLKEHYGDAHEQWKRNLVLKYYERTIRSRIGSLRAAWKEHYDFDLDLHVHPLLFRILCAFLDQGISIWNFPVTGGFLDALRRLHSGSPVTFLRSGRAIGLLLDTSCTADRLLCMLAGDQSLHEQYLFDQQFAHPGWSGMVSVIEAQPGSLIDQKEVTLHELVVLELLMEIDALDMKFGTAWKPLSETIRRPPVPLFEQRQPPEKLQVLALWQEAMEWSYYDQVLKALVTPRADQPGRGRTSFQAVFCIDDREASLRDYIEDADRECETYSTPGHFNVAFYFKPQNGKTYTKQCPAPVTPVHLIKEVGFRSRRRKDPHFHKRSHSLVAGWVISQTLGFWSVLRLIRSLFRPEKTPAAAAADTHMQPGAYLTIERNESHPVKDGLFIGFSVEEMAERVEGLLTGIALTSGFAPLVYIIGHGSTSVNNPHYAAYNCGACSGRPGSVNARVFAYMANHPRVRALVAQRGVRIPDDCTFVGALHDTTRDEILFYDTEALRPRQRLLHSKNAVTFNDALRLNARERARRFENENPRANAVLLHERVKRRSVSLFETRPELNHATNALCIVGRRHLTRNLFLDRRAFLSSYDHGTDPDGRMLAALLAQLAPVCGGINLEYFFSRTDNKKLGAGTKLPHNVMGLFGVANGTDGDLRPGLPSQMVEQHDPLRLLVVIEQDPVIVENALAINETVKMWFTNEWIHLAALHPVTKIIYRYRSGRFTPYEPFTHDIPVARSPGALISKTGANIPVHVIKG